MKEDDIVFIPSLTFAVSVNPVRYEKAVPVFIVCILGLKPSPSRRNL